MVFISSQLLVFEDEQLNTFEGLFFLFEVG